MDVQPPLVVRGQGRAINAFTTACTARGTCIRLTGYCAISDTALSGPEAGMSAIHRTYSTYQLVSKIGY